MQAEKTSIRGDASGDLLLPAPSYVFASDQRRTDCLVSFARQDAFFAQIVGDLERFGFEVSFSFWARSGLYRPVSVSCSGLHHEFSKTFRKMLSQGDLRARFCFSPRYGQALNVHDWLHELMHFYQDMLGLFLQPLEREGQMPVLMDARSSIAVMLFCEALAEVQAIRGAWRLKHAGFAQAWKGARRSPNWGRMAQHYEAEMRSGTPEGQVAQKIFVLWYELPARRYYERRAFALYQKNLKRYMEGAGLHSLRDVAPYFRSVDLAVLTQRLPGEDFAFLGLEKLDMGTLRDQATSRKLEQFEQQVGVCNNSNFHEIEIGSPPYIWKNVL